MDYFLSSPEAFIQLSKPFTPDHIVYAGAWPLYLFQSTARNIKHIESSIHGYISDHDELPKILAIQGIGVVGLGKDHKAAERACLLFRDALKIAWYAQSFGGVHPMGLKRCGFYPGWEVEKFRSGRCQRADPPSSESAPILKEMISSYEGGEFNAQN